MVSAKHVAELIMVAEFLIHIGAENVAIHGIIDD
jgi:hypothetical protein